MRDDWRTAVIEGDCRAIEGLLEDTDIDCRDHYGQTALMLAVLHGREEVASLLLEKGADLNVTAKYRLSALMLAVIRGHEAIARQLVDAGANLELRGTGAPGFSGKTARDLAIDHALVDLAGYIERAER